MACNCPNELPAIVPTQQINSIISLFKKWGALVNRYIDRCVDRLIERDLVIFGAVLVQGPKWCGKTTTAHRFAESSLSLSDPAGGFAALQLARLDPAQAITGAAPRLIDEWQEEPKLWDAVRFECDARGGEPGQFILTGSATPNDADRPMHSGVGRISRLRMDTMTLSELGVSSGAVSIGALFAGDPGDMLPSTLQLRC